MLAAPADPGKPQAGDFAARVLAWQARHGRSGLPWSASTDPYRVWLAEIMLQQTQVATVIPYYLGFLDRFPHVAALAAAPVEAVMASWSGLGYYARARNLHAAARAIVTKHGGRFPRRAREIAELPGVGRSTAAAIAAFCWGERAAILDGNVKRVLTRYFGIAGDPSRRATERLLWERAESLLPERPAMAAYTQAMMDLGAGCCTRRAADCGHCPLADGCVAYREGRVDELPTPKASRELPRRECIVLAIVAAERVLVERRPPTGIWGGMLSLPECAVDAGDTATRVLQLCGRQPLAIETLEPLAHSFTHFRLTLRPLRVHVGQPSGLAEPSGQHWLRLDELAAAALPTPIRRILAGLTAS